MQLTAQELQIIQAVIDDQIDSSQRYYRHKFYDEFKQITKKLDYLINSHGSADADSFNEPPYILGDDIECNMCGYVAAYHDLPSCPICGYGWVE